MEKNSEYSRRPRRHEIRPITIEQVKHLLEAAQDQSLKALLTLAITTGLRRGELLGLCWQDIDMQNEVIYVRRIISSFGGIEATDTVRTIAVPKIAIRMLNEQRRLQEVARVKMGATWHDLDLVFPDEQGQYYNPHHFWGQYHTLFVATGHAHMRFHDLRHITIALFVQMGVNIQVIQAIVGFRHHSTSITTLTPVSLSMQKEAMQKWDALFGEVPFEAPSRTIEQILLHKPESEEE